MATRITKRAVTLEDLLPPLPPEGPELDALIKAAVAEIDPDAPCIPMAEVFADLRKHIAERARRET